MEEVTVVAPVDMEELVDMEVMEELVDMEEVPEEVVDMEAAP